VHGNVPLCRRMDIPAWCNLHNTPVPRKLRNGAQYAGMYMHSDACMHAPMPAEAAPLATTTVSFWGWIFPPFQYLVTACSGGGISGNSRE
jgi:hypothetical protein